MTKRREDNPNWKGGRTVSSHGYILVRVGKEHHLADSNGYAYEHRMVAEEKLGRCLRPGELIHHINKDRLDNRQENLKIVSGNAAHYVFHRKRQDLRLPNEPNLWVKCKCGCRQSFQRYDANNRPREYISGHNPIPAPLQERILQVLKSGEVHRQQIASLCQASVRSVGCALSRLKQKDLVKQTGFGVWALIEHPGQYPPNNPLMECACGCGEKFRRFDKHWRPRRFVSGHNSWKGKRE